MAQPWEPLDDLRQHQRRAITVLDIGGVDHGVDQIALGVCQDVALASRGGISPSALSDPYVKLSLHTAPIRQTVRSDRRASVRKDQDCCGQSFPGIALHESYVLRSA
jgi:hypothetical protein